MMVFSAPNTVDSDRPVAPLATQTRWWEWVRADAMEYWKRGNPVEWDAPTKVAGGAEYTEKETSWS